MNSIRRIRRHASGMNKKSEFMQVMYLDFDSATKNIDKSVYILEKFLVHRARSRRPKGASY